MSGIIVEWQDPKHGSGFSGDYLFKQGLVKGVILCFRNLYFYFRHWQSTSPASQKVFKGFKQSSAPSTRPCKI